MSRLVAVAAMALTAAACGGSSTSSAGSPSPSPIATASTSTPTQSGLTFKLNGISTTASGTITVTTSPGTVTVALTMSGLQPNSLHVSHVHIGSCGQRGAVVFALNQVAADGQGAAQVMTTVSQTYPPAGGSWYAVVHAGPDMQGSSATYLLCGNLFT
ncbi:MAG TPA: CHRD domain-containing protein [Candidatus Dormibacteraeota bacterium]|nr:CHRD domain-containing protein [Candidatus Dormibacteraeota bacterium]